MNEKAKREEREQEEDEFDFYYNNDKEDFGGFLKPKDHARGNDYYDE